MLRSGALLVGCGLLALLGAIIVHDGQGASWLIATSVAVTVAGVALLVVAPWPTERRPLRVQLVDDQADEQAVTAREILDAHARRHAEEVTRGPHLLRTMEEHDRQPPRG